MDAKASRLRTRVLVLTDEVQLFRLARAVLAPRGCAVEAASPAARGGVGDYDVVILDLPRLDPSAVERRRREFPAAEILVLSGECRESDAVAVIEAGADWLVRPFRSVDLAAKVRAAQLRRLAALGAPRRYVHGELMIDLVERRVWRSGSPVAVTPSEQRLLTIVARAGGRVATIAEIVAGLRRDGSPRARQSVHALVSNLRRKIERDRAHPEILLNEARVGYRLAAETREPSPNDVTPRLAANARGQKP
jgi:two-component system KDP operon response regulator KdpE